MIILGLGAGSISLSAGAFIGAFAAFFFVALLSNGARGGADQTILAGVAASQLFNAATSYIVTTSGNAQQARDVMFWLLGSFGAVRWPEFALVSGRRYRIDHLPLLCARAGRVRVWRRGRRITWRQCRPGRLLLFGITAIMTATIVSMVGTIGFVGLVVPHAARFVVGPLHVRLMPACAIVGAIFMVAADIASRVLIPQQVLPIGVVTALVGVPFFAIILYRFRRAS